MPYQSRWRVDIPNCALPTLVFKSPSEALDDKNPCFLDATRPESHYFTPSTFRVWCQRLALGLLRSGKFEKGDRLLLFSGNDLFYPVVFMGVIMAGGIFTGANPSYVARELAYQMKDNEPKLLLCVESSMDTAMEAAKLVGMPKENVFIFNDAVYDGDLSHNLEGQEGFLNWGRLLATPEDAREFAWDESASLQDIPQRTIALNYSSGTTGYHISRLVDQEQRTD